MAAITKQAEKKLKMKQELDSIDTDKFVTELEIRPCIWNNRLKDSHVQAQAAYVEMQEIFKVSDSESKFGRIVLIRITCAHRVLPPSIPR